MSVYVQIGAGAGDQDPRSNYRDGFTEYVKSLDKRTISRIVLVEPNPVNIPNLLKCWADYPQVEIYNIGIVPKAWNKSGTFFYYEDRDAPHYHVLSAVPEHVQKCYAFAVLKKIYVGCMCINEFNRQFLANEHIAMYATDIEGLDQEIIEEFDFSVFDCLNFSFEYLHLTDPQKAVDKLTSSGFYYGGLGIDYNGYDWIFKKNG